jgi:hypothetical protein
MMSAQTNAQQQPAFQIPTDSVENCLQALNSL